MIPQFFGIKNFMQLMIDWWFGLVLWIFEIPQWKGLLPRGAPARIPDHQPKPPIYY